MPISQRKVSVKFGMASTAINGVTVFLNENRPRTGRVAAGNEELSASMIGLRDGERFVPKEIIVDLCTSPGGGGTTAVYQLRRGIASGAMGNNGTALTITTGVTSGRLGIAAPTAYGPSDRMTLGVTGAGGAANHTSIARVEGYIIGRGK